MAELSGKAWVTRFPGSKSVDDLESTFRADVKGFIDALTTAGASLDITSTYRPPERAYLMHWSWLIVKKNQDAQKIEAMPGVDIQWWHGSADKSKAGAREMVDGYQIGGLNVAPSLKSRHTEKKAIDLAVTWAGTLKVKKKDDTEVQITSTPRDSSNVDLIAIGSSYSVIHFANAAEDKNHWSTDGH